MIDKGTYAEPSKIVGHKTFSDGHGGFRHAPLTREEADLLIMTAEAAKAKRSDDMPTSQDAVNALWSVYQRLYELGWRDARYAQPGEEYQIIELGSSGIHVGRKTKKPDCFWIYKEGDWWPSHPCLYKKT